MQQDDVPFTAFAAETVLQSPLRQAITAACRRTEPEAIAALYQAASLTLSEEEVAQATAIRLIRAVRATPDSELARLLRAYPLDSAEGLALMGLAEALLRTPDVATRNDLLRDKLVGRGWSHSGLPFGRALALAAWLASGPTWKLFAPLVRLAALGVVRRIGHAFVLGETMTEALARAAPLATRGFLFSFDMLGEAAMTADDAEGFFQSYRTAILSLKGDADIRKANGISIKLSALHPRYTRAQRSRVLAELAPRLVALAKLARERSISISIDAEESERLDLSLDLLETLCQDQGFSGWNGIGYVVQAYGKRAPAVIDFCADLARRTGRRLMLRLVKGAYWDQEIKQAQLGGFLDFPVYTRKIHTDIAYLACARQMLALASLYPQFATHNANSIGAILAMAGNADYEFQCLHGMGEEIYGAVHNLPHARPCRIYAPVGPHKTLLAYLVRRLLENGANSSFIHRLHDHTITPETLWENPVAQSQALTPQGAPHEAIVRPPALFGAVRQNSEGLDLADESVLAGLAGELATGFASPVVRLATESDVETAFSEAQGFTPPPPHQRAQILFHIADHFERHRVPLVSLLVREARRTIPDALGELREAVDFCRYYAAQIEAWLMETHLPLGTVVCISPWNFSLSIFIGQIAGAFAAGNAVIAKPAEETPEIAALAAQLAHDAGLPRAALHVLHGDGALGAKMVASPSCRGVVFTGSLAAARAINVTLAQRLNPDDRPVPLIAETGGMNAMIVDSTALPEQAISDILYSAFNSAGQRCSALRLLCVQQEIAGDFLSRLRAAMLELRVGPPDRLSTDLGPLISHDAATSVRRHIELMRQLNCQIFQGDAPDDAGYVPPTIIEAPNLSLLTQEIFGPVLHVLRFPRATLASLPGRINALGYGLTFGAHGRVDARLRNLAEAIRAGNIYVNRNIIGAVVGVQPFGGDGLSGTGPKAGGPLYLHRLLAKGPAFRPVSQDLKQTPLGERNEYTVYPRGLIFCKAQTPAGRRAQEVALNASGCTMTMDPEVDFRAVLLEADTTDIISYSKNLAARRGPIVPLYALTPKAVAAGAQYNPSGLVVERSLSTNIAAVGGNASLMAKI
ncbi:L-glutamate gamma-semialdehyde dehydrogenase [Acidocella sp.]|uniref:L-glutamate gamma-semialdehyde dehydrogenase n=1 Tax=Acidocella sp. TaxID=50710 RepID=UPI002612FAC1|nr:L-glutamate gamma-semialdehyde dehydrogenase [Acidocella sp.]